MVRAYLQLARWPNALLAAAGVFVGAWLALWTGGRRVSRARSPPPAPRIALTVTANAWNDAARRGDRPRRAPGAADPVRARSRCAAARNAALACALAGRSRSRGRGAPGSAPSRVAVAALMIALQPVAQARRAPRESHGRAARVAPVPLRRVGRRGSRSDGLALVAWAFPLHLARELAKDIDDADGRRGPPPHGAARAGGPRPPASSRSARSSASSLPLPLFASRVACMLRDAPRGRRRRSSRRRSRSRAACRARRARSRRRWCSRCSRSSLALALLGR